MRVTLTQPPYGGQSDGKWPARWIACAAAGAMPFATAYRRQFTLDMAATVRVHVTADERYELFLDGVRVGRGSERGDGEYWYVETYDLALTAGAHTLVARVWSLGELAPFAQMSLRPGFLLSPDDEAFVPLLATGVAEWDAKRLPGYEFVDPMVAWGTGANVVVHGDAFAWGFECGAGDGWESVTVQEEGADALRRNDFAPTRLLRPATLPPMMERDVSGGVVKLVAALESLPTHAVPIRAADDLPAEHTAWQALMDGAGEVTLAPHTRRRVLIDLNEYYCAYPTLRTSGGAGATVRIYWQESLFDDAGAQSKGNRDETEGKYFVCIWHIKDGVGDIFRPDGGANRAFDTLWWQCGRYVEVVVETQADALTLHALRLTETRYPLENESRFEAGDGRLAQIVPLMTRALQMCSHETYMDCPYYEQLMYIGDTRLECLATYALSHDDRLPRKAMTLFGASRLTNGLTQSRYPSRVRQIIPPFSLWWVAMLFDYAWWRDDLPFVRSLMPGARGVLDYFDAFIGADGLLASPPGWNYIDWVPAWDSGMPQGHSAAPSGPLNWQYVLTLTLAAALEEALGEPERAARCRRRADALAAAVLAAFWDEGRGLPADDLGKTLFSEHSPCLALLSGLLPDDKRERIADGLLRAPDLARTTIYFTHYLFETFALLGRPDRILDRLGLWFDLAGQGLKTTVEMPEPTRSDCHAWGAHPLYHHFASLLGIRPAAPGFSQVTIAPQLGPLAWASGTLPHPRGEISVSFTQKGDRLTGEVMLPDGVTGALHWQGRTLALRGGAQTVAL